MMAGKKGCGDCSLCCSYVTVETPEPKDAKDVDHLIWLIHHQNVAVFIDDEGWYVQFITPCRHQNGKCAIYPCRPDICRDYSHTECEFYMPEEDKAFFKDAKDILAYLKEHKPELWKEISATDSSHAPDE